MSNFSKIKIADIGLTITGKTPSSKNPEDFGFSETMFVTPSDSFDKKTMNSTERYLSIEGVRKLSNKLLPLNSVMVTCIGSAMGKVTMNAKRCITNQQINSIIPNDNHDSNYIYYALKNNYKLLRNASSGSTALPILNKTDFDLLEIVIHNSKKSQQKIATVLSALDAKIELNNQINAELEKMAKTIYDYWFVQFDFPDANGKPYKSSGGKMVWNEELKREIPTGWEVLDLDKIENNIITGKTPSTSNDSYFDGDVPFICIGDVRGNMHIVETEITLTQAGAESQNNKFIPKGSICVTCIASPGLVAFATRDSQTNQQLNSIVCEYLENRYYLYFYLTDYFKYAKAKTGNTFANMNKGDFSVIKVLKPSKELLINFCKILDSSIDKILNNSLENQTLAELRDWLLPMLMNGQVKVD
jgi:type I restriction enzyme S subunit